MDAAVCRTEVCYPFGWKHGRYWAVKRREFITLLGGAAAAWPLAARAQPSGRPVRVGILTPGGELANPLFATFRQEMRRLGYVEGHNLILEFRSAASDADRLPELAAELVRLPVDVMLVEATAAARAAKQAFPDMMRVGVLRNPRNPSNELQLASIKKAAATLGVDVETAEAERRDAIGPALDQLRERGASALIILGDSFFFNEHKLIVLLVTAARLPAIYPDRVYADAGGMMFYGPDITDNFRRAADYVDRILKGSKTSDLPVQQPTKFELIINATIAKAIGVTLPTTLLLRADEVIE